MTSDLSHLMDEFLSEERNSAADVGDTRLWLCCHCWQTKCWQVNASEPYLGQKLSITSRRPQTTRPSGTGIKTEDDVQTVYVDTPGMHKAQKKAINRYMNKAASSALADVDAILFVVDRLTWTKKIS